MARTRLAKNVVFELIMYALFMAVLAGANVETEDLKETGSRPDESCVKPLPWKCTSPLWVEKQLLESVEKYAGGKAKGCFFSSNVHVFCDPKKGRGLKFTGKVMNKSEIFLRLPLHALYNGQSIMSEKIQPVNHMDALAMVILEQTVLHNSYVSTLPLEEGVPTGFRLCNNELHARINDEDLREEALEMRRMVRERALELKSLGWLSDPSRYERAISVAQSRVFIIRGKKAGKWVKIPSLVMLADSLNLALPGQANTDCQTNEASTHFECYATRDIMSGEELLAPFEKHGSEDMNSYTWFHYGFEFSKAELEAAAKSSNQTQNTPEKGTLDEL